MFFKRKDRVKVNNAGLSLVELVVIMAIMAVMLGTAGISMSLLSGAEAKQAAQKLVAVLNDTKTGNFTRAGEELVVRYITTSDDWAKKGVDKSGYYADKCIYTIMNDAQIKQLYSNDHEYNMLGKKKVTIKIYTSSGDYTLSNAGSDAVRISFDRKTGAFKDLEYGNVDADGNFSGSSVGKLSKIEFMCGVKTYTLTVNSDLGTYSL